MSTWEWTDTRRMAVYLARKSFEYSFKTIHKYINVELGLQSIVRRKKPGYRHGTAYKVHDNLLHQDFTADKPNQKWRTDSMYLFPKNGEVRYNCTILDLYDRRVVASVTDRNITSGLAVRTLQKVLDSPQVKGGMILHSDQGSQYTSQTFTDFCAAKGISQSMSKAGCPYDNVPMERYFNTLKNECTDLFEFLSGDSLFLTVQEFAYVTYNHLPPHSCNAYLTPWQARSAQ